MTSTAEQRAQTKADQDRVLAYKKEHPTSPMREIARALDIHENRIAVWKTRSKPFRARWDLLVAGAEEMDVLPSSFLDWRELTCAYLDHRTKRINRAQNSWMQAEMYKALQSHNRLLVILPPGHLKTTTWCIEYPTHRIMSDRNTRIMVVQKNQGEARKVIAAVEERLSSDEYYDWLQEELKKQGDDPIVNPLRTWFSTKPFKPQNKQTGAVWSADGFRVVGARSGEKDHTMQALGVGSQIQGIRADLILLDDIQDPEVAVKSPQDAVDKLGWVQRVILGRITEAQQLVVLANRFTDDDFASKLMETYPDWPVMFLPAIYQDDDGPHPLCPEFWTLEGLEMKKKEVGEQTWHYTWMQEEGSFSDATFRREALEAARNEDLVLGDVPFPVTDIFMGVDPAISSNGYCAICVWGLDRRTKQRYLIDIFNKSGMRNWDNIERQIVEFARMYQGRTCVIEHAGQQESLINQTNLNKELRSLGWKIEGYKTATGTGARAEQTNFDITTVGGLFDVGLITLPYGGTVHDRARVDEYIDQLCKWRTDDAGRSIKYLTKDMVMATLFAESAAFVVANKPIEAPQQDPNRRGRWTTGSWRRFNRN